jgi:polysaccharide biosynthesis protein PslA
MSANSTNSGLVAPDAQEQSEQRDSKDFVVRGSLIAKGPLTRQLKVNLQRRRGTRSLASSLLMFSDLLSCICAFIFANVVYLQEISWQNSGNMLAVCLPIFLLFSINNNAHNAIFVMRFWSGVFKALMALGFAGASLLLTLFFLKTGAEYSRGIVLIGGVSCLVTLPLGRAFVRFIMRSRIQDGLYAQVCIFDGVPLKQIPGVVSLEAKSHGLIPSLDSAETIGRLGILVKGLDRVIVYSDAGNRAKWAMVLKALDIPCEIVLPELNQYHALSISRFDGNSALLLTSGRLKWNQSLIKRIFDLGFSCCALLVLAPLLLFIAAWVRIDSAGPIFFRQERIGLGNRRFNLYKFRSMYQKDSDRDGKLSVLPDDPRVTKAGALIRRTSLDELPQLINVLVGDMSIVGPRPHATESRAGGLLFWEVDNAYWHRHVVKPGITGLAQISGHRGNTFHEDDLQKRLDADLLYVENWSFWEDIRILLKTFSVLSHKNAF